LTVLKLIIDIHAYSNCPDFFGIFVIVVFDDILFRSVPCCGAKASSEKMPVTIWPTNENSGQNERYVFFTFYQRSFLDNLILFFDTLVLCLSQFLTLRNLPQTKPKTPNRPPLIVYQVTLLTHRVQVDLIICGLFICEFAYMRLRMILIYRTYPLIYSHPWSFYMRICYLRVIFFNPYLSHITRSACTVFYLHFFYANGANSIFFQSIDIFYKYGGIANYIQFLKMAHRRLVALFYLIW
jgi:hypothetical protein